MPRRRERPVEDQRLRDLRRAARSLARSLDVCGVYWGVRRRRGVWCDEPCISVQVHKKHTKRRLPESRLLPRSIDGFRVDVVEVGVVHAAALSHDDAIKAPGHLASTITCLRKAALTEIHALVSGHGTLPLVNHKIQRRFPGPSGPPGQVVVRDGSGALYHGTLLVGRIDAQVDCAVASFHAPADVVHAIAGSPPLVRRSGAPAAKEKLRRHAAGGDERVGVYTGGGLVDQPVNLGDGSSPINFAGVLRIADHGLPFAQQGDSGALVCDAQGKAVGVVAACSPGYTFILPIAPMLAAFTAEVAPFFT